MTTTVADQLLTRLREWGVEQIFGYPGDGINGFMEALRKRHDEIRYVHVRHEEVGAMAAVAAGGCAGACAIRRGAAAHGDSREGVRRPKTGRFRCVPRRTDPLRHRRADRRTRGPRAGCA